MAEDPLPVPDRPAPPPTWRDVVDRLVPAGRATALRWAAAGLAVLLVAAVAWWALRPPPAPATELSLPYAGQPSPAPAPPGAPSTPTTAAAELVVHAAGAVVSPGVHRVPAGARVGDLLAAAGGPAPDADLDAVNLAAPLADGERVRFPRIGEPPPPAPAGDGGTGAGDDGPIDLNRATAAQLETLPGVGPAIAAAIVEHRERNGPFRSVDELLDVPGIGPARLAELRPLVTV